MQQNHGTDTRPDGYYRVKYEGIWIIAQYEKSAYGRGWWSLPGRRGEKADNEFDEISEVELSADPSHKNTTCHHQNVHRVYDKEGEYIYYDVCLDCLKAWEDI